MSFRDAMLYRKRTERLARLLDQNAPSGIVVQECWLVIRSFGVSRLFWIRVRYWFQLRRWRVFLNKKDL